MLPSALTSAPGLTSPNTIRWPRCSRITPERTGPRTSRVPAVTEVLGAGGEREWGTAVRVGSSNATGKRLDEPR